MNKKVERMINIGVIAALVALFFEQAAYSVTNGQAYKAGFSAGTGDGTGAIYALDDSCDLVYLNYHYVNSRHTTQPLCKGI